MLELLRARGPGKSICPSEAARVVAGPGKAADWRPLIPAARRAARRLAAKKLAEIWQHGRRVDPSTVRGAIRIRLRSGAPPTFNA